VASQEAANIAPMTEESRRDLVRTLIECRQLLAAEIQLQNAVAAAALYNAHKCEADDKLLVEMLGRHGYIEKPSGLGKPPVSLGIGGLAGLSLGEPPSLDGQAAEWIKAYGTTDAARRWCEMLVRTRQIPPPVTVPKLYDKFPPALKACYHRERGNAIESLRQQIRAWYERGLTWLVYEGSEITGFPPESNLASILAAITPKKENA
jgi:hypothetical protein